MRSEFVMEPSLVAAKPPLGISHYFIHFILTPTKFFVVTIEARDPPEKFCESVSRTIVSKKKL